MRQIAKSTMATILFLTASAAVADGRNRSVEVNLRGADGRSLSFSLSADFVDGVLEGLAGARVACDTTTDADTLAMLHHLDRRGVGSRYRFDTGEGKTIKARRRRSGLELKVIEDGEKPVRIELPWAIAQCMMGRSPSVDRGDDVTLSIEQEGSVRISIE